MNNIFGNMQYMQYLMSEFNNFKNNPVQWLTQRNINNPQQVLQNPQQAVQSMMGNENINNNQFGQIMSLAQMLQGLMK